MADLKIFRRETPKILDDATYFTRIVTQNKNAQVIHTGFSLGGFIADCCVNIPQNSCAVSFDAPGCDFLMRDGRRIVDYVTNPNLVNSCNAHVGEVRRLSFFAAKDTSNELARGISVLKDKEYSLVELISTI